MRLAKKLFKVVQANLVNYVLAALGILATIVFGVWPLAMRAQWSWWVTALVMAACFIVPMILVALVLWLNEVRRFRRRRPTGEPDEALRFPRKAILFTVGMQSVTIMHALDKQNPKLVGFLCSEETRKVAEDVAQKRGYDDATCKTESCQPFDVNSAYRNAHILLEWLAKEKGLEPGDVAVDLTGGTVPMTVGASIAAEELGVDCQYVASDYEKTPPRRPKPGTQKVQLAIRSW